MLIIHVPLFYIREDVHTMYCAYKITLPTSARLLNVFLCTKSILFVVAPQRTPRKGNFDLHNTLNENKRDREEAYSSYH